MKLLLKRQPGESNTDWYGRQIDRNLALVIWMWKWLLLPMWAFILVSWLVRRLR